MQTAPPHHGRRLLRPHARPHRRLGAPRGHRPQLHRAPHRGGVLARAALRRVRRRRVLARLLPDLQVARPGPRLHRHPAVSLALLPPRLRVRQPQQRDCAAAGSRRQDHGRAGIFHDGRAVAARPVRARLRRAARRHALARRRHRAAQPRRPHERRRRRQGRDRADPGRQVPQRHAGGGRDRRHDEPAHPLVLPQEAPRRGAPVPRLSRRRARLV